MSELTDINYLKSLIEEQRMAISQISHEVRNPVALIHSSLQIIEKEHPEVCTFAFWEEVCSDMRYLVQLLEELSSYNNGETLRPEPLAAVTWLNALAHGAELIVPDKCRLFAKIDPELPDFYVDPVKLRQALTNLLCNAFEALEDGGDVYFTVSADSSCIKIEIRDTGCGIPNEYMADLFTPFVTHKSSGTGLGLAITKRIIDAHGGTILVDSRVGQGTAFVLLLPTM